MAYTLKPEEVGVLPLVVWEKSGKHIQIEYQDEIIIVDAGLNSQKMTSGYRLGITS